MKTEFEKSTIKDLRDIKGMSQLQFARLVGTSRQMLDKWEKGDCKPGMDSLLKISNACNVPVSHFFNQNDVSVHHTAPQEGEA